MKRLPIQFPGRWPGEQKGLKNRGNKIILELFLLAQALFCVDASIRTGNGLLLGLPHCILASCMHMHFPAHCVSRNRWPQKSTKRDK